MARKASRRPVPAAISNAVEHNLKLYSSAAIAAGVSMLALVPPAEAHVVITQKTIPIPVGQPISIDLNHDGMADFQFNMASSVPDCAVDYSFAVKPLTGGAVAGSPFRSYIGYASALKQGATIGPSAHFSATSQGRVVIERSNMAYCSFSYHRELFGHWGWRKINRYLGVKFLIHGATHYGWVRMTVDFLHRRSDSATITAYAYETVANKRITAGNASDSATDTGAQQDVKPGRPSLGMLALGADGLAIWRRDIVDARQHARIAASRML